MTDDPDQQDAERARGNGPRIVSGLVALAVVLGLAGVVGPGVAGEVENVRRGLALQDMQEIVTGLREYSHDTLTLPTGVEGRTNVRWLVGPGALPGNLPFADESESRALDDVLISPAMGGKNWRGPYLLELPVDPWERAYLVSVSGLVDGRSTPMVLSAGPDGICDTAITARAAAGDDILLPLN